VLGPKDLKRFIEQKEVDAEVLELSKQVATSSQAASALGVSENVIAKTVVLVADDGEPILVFLAGSKRVKQKWLARKLGKRRLRLAKRGEVEEITGYPAGGVPPIGLAKKLRMVVDEELLSREYVYAGGGSDRHLLKVRPSDVVRLNNALILKLP